MPKFTDTNGVQIGDTVTDSVTGLSGVVTGIVHYITGCAQATVQPPVKAGAWTDAHWIDVDRLYVTNEPNVVVPVRTRVGAGEPPPAK